MESALALRIFGLIVLLLGVVLTISGILSQQKQHQVKGWAKAKGTITHAYFADDSEGGRLEITYEYAVEGKLFSSSRLAPSLMLYKASDMARKYPPGAEITVYYNPKNPKEAVLEPKSPVTGILIVMGIVCMGIAALLLFLAR